MLSSNLAVKKNGLRALGVGKKTAIHKISGWGMSNYSSACDL